MSLASHAVKRLRELYRVILLRMWALENRRFAGPPTVEAHL
jgi:hypothetical protein